MAVREIRNPPVTACGGASHLGLRAAALRRLASKRACGRSLWQGGLWSRNGPVCTEKPPLPKGGGPPDAVRWRGDST